MRLPVTLRRVVVPLFLAVAPLVIPQPAMADEREALVRLAHEIEALQPLIEEAKQAGPSHSRFRFAYGDLEHELLLVRMGILAYLTTPDTTPREIEPLRGDYLR